MECPGDPGRCREVTSEPATGAPARRVSAHLADRLFDIKTIYHEPDIDRFDRAREVFDRYPGAERIVVPSHAAIPGLYGNQGNVDDWVRLKREVLVLGEKKSLSARPNGRSSDWIAPSTANGCAMSCSYCYVPRRKGYANPVTVFANIDRILGYLERHAGRQGVKTEPNQCDPTDWVYDIGENSDCSADALIGQRARPGPSLRPGPQREGELRHQAGRIRQLLDLDPKGGTRIRFSLMPEATSKIVDVRTSTIAERIAVIDDFVEAGYEVHVNFSPVIVQEGWLEDWAGLLDQLADGTSARTKAQLAAEIIFLTHNEDLHEVNLGWHPQGEELLWRPDLQQAKQSQSGQWNVRYRSPWGAKWVAQLNGLIAASGAQCRIRYAF